MRRYDLDQYGIDTIGPFGLCLWIALVGSLVAIEAVSAAVRDGWRWPELILPELESSRSSYRAGPPIRRVPMGAPEAVVTAVIAGRTWGLIGRLWVSVMAFFYASTLLETVTGGRMSTFMLVTPVCTVGVSLAHWGAARRLYERDLDAPAFARRVRWVSHALHMLIWGGSMMAFPYVARAVMLTGGPLVLGIAAGEILARGGRAAAARQALELRANASASD